jgi:DNA polymerase III subunit gamma/tau
VPAAVAPSTVASPPAAPVAPAPVPEATAHPGSLDAAAVRRVWDEVLTVVRKRSQRSWAVVREAMVRDVRGDEIVLVFQHAVHANMFSGSADILVEAVREVLGGSWRVRVEQGEAAGVAAAAVPEPAPVARPAAPAPNATAPAAPVAAAPRPAMEVDDTGWPTPATPGGGAPVATAPAGGSSHGSPDPGGSAPGASDGGSGGHGAAIGDAPVSGGSGTGGPGASGRGSGRAGSGRSAPTGRSGGEGDLEEPPWDPDNDLAEDAGEATVLPPGARETSEEQAIRVLTETFGAERIGEGNPRG